MHGRGSLFAILLTLPALAGCAQIGFDRVDRWDIELPVGVLVSQRAGPVLDDVVASAELATRQLNTLEVGIRYTISTDLAPDSVAAGFDRLAAKRVALVVAAVLPSEASAVADRAAQKKLPLILVTPPNATFTPAQAPYLLSIAPPPARAMEALASRVTAAGIDSVVLFSTPDGFAAQAATAFDAAFAGTITRHDPLAADAHGPAINAGRAVCASGEAGIVALAPPAETGWLVRGLYEGGCRERVSVFASAQARQIELVQEAGRDLNNSVVARGVQGIEPESARLGEFRALFDAEYGRNPGVGAAATYDALTYATLASFLAHASLRAEPVRAKIDADDLQARLSQVASAPGVKHRDIRLAIDAVKRGDEIDWIGYAHDFDLTQAGVPGAESYATWIVTQTGGIERAR